MTKRPFPFEPDICRQSKIHLNNYENDVIALRDVKERTLKKLLDGSRRSHSIMLNNRDCLDSAAREIHSRDNLMQKLVTNYITVNGKIVDKSGSPASLPIQWPSTCFFCESKSTTTFQCVQCQEFFCCACSFVDYESLEDRRTCLSCS